MNSGVASREPVFPAASWLWLAGLSLPGLGLMLAFLLNPVVPPSWLFVGGALMSGGMFLLLARIWRLQMTRAVAIMLVIVAGFGSTGTRRRAGAIAGWRCSWRSDVPWV